MKTGKKQFRSIVTGFLLLAGFFLALVGCSTSSSEQNQSTSQSQAKQASTYQPSDEEKASLKERFDPLVATNPDTIGYVYAPGTMLDEPVVQTNDNETYLDKTFDGGHEPYMGTVFMDMDNKKDFSDRLTWLFGHARGSKVPDSRMFNDVNHYSNKEFFDAHPYVVVETPERKFYYEAVAMIIVPETTAFYRTEFDSDQDFVEQLNNVYNEAQIKKTDVEIKAEDRYLVLSTCREEDETIRANLYLRQIPDDEMEDFLKEHGDQLTYQATR
ncbi:MULTISPECIES: class B sortase, LPKTxAVK-specific [unclassified Streptococcus]|uniref:class B sortase, LPKTxAVK-specific n=1 Tax=unclassified Streptococcus TaxID=2608887 RepID=UPI0018A8C437|nr:MULTISPECIES: class B sortase, LPKTxAVK-specific [unclassified Streptococcus]MBF8970679.1 class B sortase [Streptococcus sp. NLN76]MBJ6745704.1 class B sortase [Streptococcus sp. 121]